MTIGTAVEIIRSGVIQILMIASPVLIIGVTVGLIVSIIQATTSIQEQTLTFVPKIAAILTALMLFGQWMLTRMRDFTIILLERIPEIAG